MQIDAHVNVEIDGRPALLEAKGNQLELTLSQDETLDLLLESDTFLVEQVAEILAELGLTLTINNKNQPLVKVGHGVSSRVSGLVTGSKHIAPANPSGLAILARSYLSGRQKGT